MKEFSNFDILKQAKENNLFNAKREWDLSVEERRRLRASVDELERQGYLSNSGSKIVYYLTDLGNLVVEEGGFKEFEEKKSASKEFEIIAKTFEEIAKIHQNSSQTNKLVNTVSVVTGLFIAVQATITVFQYFYPPQTKSTLELIDRDRELLKYQTTQLDQYSRQIDSLSMELQILTKKLDSTSNHSLENK
jgi:hypothetical protein